jgi:GT2 family glycosyltransferase
MTSSVMQPVLTPPRTDEMPVSKNGSTGQTTSGLVSIVVPLFGQLEMTRLCVPRLLRHSRNPFELIFVDVGSFDGTADYLAGIADSGLVRLEVIRTDKELDLLAACAEGVSRARGEYVALISNDALVPEGWLSQLTALSRVTPTIGMVGTMSNMAPPPQWVGKVPYRIKPKKADYTPNGIVANASPLELDAMDDFAREWRDKHRGQSFEAERLGGACLLFKAEVLQKIKWTGARTSFGAIDGDMLSQKVRQAGYRLACCQDLFVHHFGSRLFAALKIDPTCSNATPAS